MVLALLVGTAIGLVLGLTGAGGSVFAVPLLILLLNLSPQEAIGISLGAVGLTSAFGVLTKLKSGNIQWLPAMVYAVLGATVAPLGNWLNSQLDGTFLLLGFSVLVVLIATKMWQKAQQEPESAEAVRASLEFDPEPSQALCKANKGKPFKIGLPCILGVSGGALSTGILSGLFGVGGGFLIVPTLIMLTSITIREAIATSLVVITVISLSGFSSYLLMGSAVDLAILLWVAGGGLLGMLLGVFTSRYIAGAKLQKTFAVLMVVMSVITVVQSLA